MPSVRFTDIAVRSLKRTSIQTTFWDAQLPSFGLRVGARRRTWIVMLGKSRQRITLGHYPATTLQEARRKAHQLIGTYQPSSSLHFKDALDAFVDQHCKRHNKASTAHATETILRRVQLSGRLDTITQHDISHILAPMLPGAANNTFTAINTLFNWCVTNQHLKVNPLQNAKRPYPRNQRDRVLNDTEIRATWHESFNHGSFGAIWRLLLLTGQRLNQITSLQTDWLRENTIVFPGFIMKNNTPHAIPLLPAALEVLEILTPINHFFFPAPCGTKPFTAFSNATRDFRHALPAIPHFNLHDARRTFSTKMSEWEICPIDVTEAILSHTTGSRSAIQRTYDRHTRLPQMRTALLNYETRLRSLLDTHTEYRQR